MEKKQIAFSTSAKPAFIAIFLVLMLESSAQKMKKLDGTRGVFYTSIEHLRKIKESEIDFYAFKT